MVQGVESGVGGASIGDNCCRVDLVESESVNFRNHQIVTYCADSSRRGFGRGCARWFGMGGCEESEKGKIEMFRSGPHPGGERLALRIKDRK